MNPLHLNHHNRYTFGSSHPLATEQLRQLVHLFNVPDQEAQYPLGGRRSISVTELADIGSVVVKHYRRGGWLSHLIKKTYFKWHKPRCRIEYEQLQIVRSAGVKAPEPIAFAYRGALLYRAWLVTKEIKKQKSLAQLSLEAPDKAETLIRPLAEQVKRLIGSAILHVDFHPGNVLVNEQDEIYLIDFDKSGPYKGSKHALKQRYLKRWQRAVTKYDLPDNLYELLLANL